MARFHRTVIKDNKGTLISNLRKIEASTYPNLCLALRDLIVGEVTKDIHKCVLRLPSIIDSVRERVKFHPLDRGYPYKRVSGVDAGSQRIPLASGRFAVIAALAFQLPESTRFFKPPEIIKMNYGASKEAFNEIVTLRRESKLFETAKNLISENPVDLILIDGPLAFGNWWATIGGDLERDSLIKSVNALLHSCAEKGVAVAGVVKRATARYLITHLGLRREVSVPDAFLLLQMMKRGQRTDVFLPSEALKRAFRRVPFMERVAFPIYSLYARLSSNPLTPPIRMDIPGFVLDEVDSIASYCLKSAVPGGIPLPIVKADEEVRITKRFVKEIYSELIPKIDRVFGSVSLVASIWGGFR